MENMVWYMDSNCGVTFRSELLQMCPVLGVLAWPGLTQPSLVVCLDTAALIQPRLVTLTLLHIVIIFHI